MAAPNQKVITIRREKPEKPFLLASFESICNAAKHLNGNKASAFMIWVYCVHNQDGFILEISHKLLEECFGMKKRSYDLAIRSLIEDEFLVKKSRQHYDFIEYPEAHKSSKSADTAHLKVPDKHIQKCHNSTFKSANMAQDNNIRQDKDRIGIERTRDHSAGMIKAETDEERDILAHMHESGFCDLPSSGTPLLTVHQLLAEDHDPEDIKEEISAVVERSKDKDREPIRDALAYLVTRLNRKENGWSYEDNEEYEETIFTDDYE